MSIRSDTTQEKGSGPVPFFNSSAQILRDAARAQGRRARPGLGQGLSPRWRGGEPGSRRLCQPPSSSPSPGDNSQGSRLRVPGGGEGDSRASRPTPQGRAGPARTLGAVRGAEGGGAAAARSGARVPAAGGAGVTLLLAGPCPARESTHSRPPRVQTALLQPHDPAHRYPGLFQRVPVFPAV